MNKKKESDKRIVFVKIRMTQKEATKLRARAAQWAEGNVSKFVRHAIQSVHSRPK